MADKQDMLNYIQALEALNDQLLFTLKKCVQVMTPFKELAPDPDDWQEMLNLFDETIKAGEGGRRVFMKEPQMTDDAVGSA
jgi:hypothetical protein